MTSPQGSHATRRLQKVGLVVLRFAIGWHLFLQGYAKLAVPGWSATSYLEHASGPFAGVYHWLAAHPLLMTLCNATIPWGMILLGAMLMIGLATRAAVWASIALLSSFVLASPPLLTGGILIVRGDGYAELYVNQTVIEILALIVIALFDTGRYLGLDVLIPARRGDSPAPKASLAGDSL
jgi:thiosulfate dehydrogenase [quinone] large subunit